MARLYIPGIKSWQRHPFSLVSNDPATFIVKARRGFTRDLYDAARSKEEIVQLRASIEGPYGGMVDLNSYDKVILIAGGSGISFTISVAMAWLRASQQSKGTLDLVWSIKDETCLLWIENELSALQANPRVNIIVHVLKLINKESGPDPYY